MPAEVTSRWATLRSPRPCRPSADSAGTTPRQVDEQEGDATPAPAAAGDDAAMFDNVDEELQLALQLSMQDAEGGGKEEGDKKEDGAK
jgi:hypothetical protein